VKSKSDPRHIKRVRLFEALFAWESVKRNPKIAIKQIVSEIPKIDEQIVKYAPKWPLDQINRIDLSILRLAIWEMLFSESQNPPKVIIDEAVEIGKEYGNESSAPFINAILGAILNQQHEQTKD